MNNQRLIGDVARHFAAKLLTRTGGGKKVFGFFARVFARAIRDYLRRHEHMMKRLRPLEGQ